MIHRLESAFYSPGQRDDVVTCSFPWRGGEQMSGALGFADRLTDFAKAADKRDLRAAVDALDTFRIMGELDSVLHAPLVESDEKPISDAKLRSGLYYIIAAKCGDLTWTIDGRVRDLFFPLRDEPRIARLLAGDYSVLPMLVHLDFTRLAKAATTPETKTKKHVTDPLTTNTISATKLGELVTKRAGREHERPNKKALRDDAERFCRDNPDLVKRVSARGYVLHRAYLREIDLWKELSQAQRSDICALPPKLDPKQATITKLDTSNIPLLPKVIRRI